MASSYCADNICLTCSRKSSNGIIRESMFFCSTNCYDIQTHAKFDIKSSSSFHSHIYSHHKPIIKQCNYCFDNFDTNMHSGIPYGRMWFCSQHHLNLANPRPKHVIVGAPGLVFDNVPAKVVDCILNVPSKGLDAVTANLYV